MQKNRNSTEANSRRLRIRRSWHPLQKSPLVLLPWKLISGRSFGLQNVSTWVVGVWVGVSLSRITYIMEFKHRDYLVLPQQVLLWNSKQPLLSMHHFLTLLRPWPEHQQASYSHSASTIDHKLQWLPNSQSPTSWPFLTLASRFQGLASGSISLLPRSALPPVWQHWRRAIGTLILPSEFRRTRYSLDLY